MFVSRNTGGGEDEVLYEAPTYVRLQRVLERAGRRTLMTEVAR